MIGVDGFVGGTPVDLPLEEKPTTLFTPVETPRTRIYSSTFFLVI